MTQLISQRHLFDIPEDVAYFNCAYNMPQLKAAGDALSRAVLRKNHPWDRMADGFFADAETVRRLAATAFGGDADGYAVVPSASYGLSSAAHALQGRVRSGAEIVVLREEFPSNVLPWQRVAKEKGAVVVAAEAETQAVLDAISAKTAVVSLAHCHWTDGSVIDLNAVAQACRARDVPLVLDVTQSLGAMPLDLDAVRPAFLVAAGYKWAMCPYGVSLMYVDAAWRDAAPMEETWLGREDADNFAGLVHYNESYQPGARRFDVGEKCTALLPGAVAGLTQLNAWGVANVASTLSALNDRLSVLFEDLGFDVPPRAVRAPHMFGVKAREKLPDDMVPRLAAQKVFVSRRGDALRVAPHLHVLDADVERLDFALRTILT